MQKSAFVQITSNHFRILVFAALATLFVVVQPSFGATINVPGDQPTLQAAANVAVAGDVVLVAAGTHVGHATFTVPVTVTGSSATPPFPVIDGQIRLSAASGSFTVSNLQVSNTTDNSNVHGVHVVNSTDSTVLVQNCILSGNFQDGVRGDSNGLTLTVDTCTVNDNQQRGVRYDGNYNGGSTIGAALIVDNCNLFNNGLANNTTNNNRGRCVEMVDNLDGSLTVTNSDLAVTTDGTQDRAIQFDNGNLQGTTFTVTNCNFTAPLFDFDLLTGNLSLAIRMIAASPDTVVENCNIVGFREPVLIRTRDQPGNVTVRNLTITDYSAGTTGGGTALLLEDIKGGGDVLIENVSLIGYPGIKAIGGGNEALKIRDLDGINVVIRNLETANTEEAMTIDRCGNCTFTIENAALYAGSGSGEQGFKLIENSTTTYTVTNSISDGWDRGLDGFSGNVGSGEIYRQGRTMTASFTGVTFTNNDIGVSFRTPGTTADHTFTVTECVFVGNDHSVSVEGGVVDNSSLEVSRSTIHESTSNSVRTQSGSGIPTTVQLCILSNWGVNAMQHSTVDGTLTESFNVFVDESGNDQFGGAQAAAIIHAGGSQTAAGLFDVYCNLDPFSVDFLNIRADGPAVMIDGLNDAGAKLACLVPASVETWHLYE